MELTRTEIDTMLRHADEVRTKLRRATRELQRFGEDAMAAREAGRTAGLQDARRRRSFMDRDDVGDATTVTVIRIRGR